MINWPDTRDGCKAALANYWISQIVLVGLRCAGAVTGLSRGRVRLGGVTCAWACEVCLLPLPGQERNPCQLTQSAAAITPHRASSRLRAFRCKRESRIDAQPQSRDFGGSRFVLIDLLPKSGEGVLIDIPLPPTTHHESTSRPLHS